MTFACLIYKFYHGYKVQCSPVHSTVRWESNMEIEDFVLEEKELQG